LFAVPWAARYPWHGLDAAQLAYRWEKEKNLLKGIVKVGLIGCGSFVALMVLLVAGLLAWDYIDQKMAEREEKKSAAASASAPEVGTTTA
jgi:hypothetical protein